MTSATTRQAGGDFDAPRKRNLRRPDRPVASLSAPSFADGRHTIRDSVRHEGHPSLPTEASRRPQASSPNFVFQSE